MRTSGYYSCMKCIARLSAQLPSLRTNVSNKLLMIKYLGIIAPLSNAHQLHWKSGNDDLPPVNSFKGRSVGEELAKKINKDEILKLINKFSALTEVKTLAAENNLDSKLFNEAVISFRKFCRESEPLFDDLYITFSDISEGAKHVTDIWPYFLKHARDIFPHLNCLEELKIISDLQQPSNCYKEARKMNRKIVFHAGPTNSGKTHGALERFRASKSGVYCAPLKLLAVEVFKKTNEKNIPCDLVTGEERQMGLPNNTPANHVACTIEMVSMKDKYEVAVIDEIQMIKDPGRGWAWTQALLGLCAEEIHICGEAAAIDLVKKIASSCGEEVEVRKYKRLTPLTIENNALMDLSKVQPGDCIVCFCKKDIFTVSLELEKRGFECAVIYGALPPGTKLAQAKKFNDPNHPCKILVATDAIGMGLNLNIQRIIFYSLIKPVRNEKGEKVFDTISTSQALQIGGRAGRFNTQFSEGFVTTFRSEDLPILKSIMAKDIEKVEKAGLNFSDDQVEEFGYHLPKITLSENINFLKSLSKMDTSLYFICETEVFQFLAEKIQHIKLPSRTRYKFCYAPINIRDTFVIYMFTEFAKQCSVNQPTTCTELCEKIGWPFSPPQNIEELEHQLSVFEVLDLYLWLSQRFVDIFPDEQAVNKIKLQLEEIIQQCVFFNITRLWKAGNAADGIEDHIGFKTYNPEYKRSLDSSDHDYMIEDRPLYQRLLSKGVLTPEMLPILQKELQQPVKERQSPFNPLKSKKIPNHPKRNKRKI